MIVSLKRPLALAGILVLSTALAACNSSQRFSSAGPSAQATPQPATIAPVQTGTVQSSNLPPIGGTTATPPTTGANTTGLYDPGTQTAASGGFAGTSAAGTGGRDLTGPLTMEKLLGGWTLVAGAQECRLNLTYTAKGSTGRYRASTPGCAQETLAGITSWQLLGSQIQFYDDANALIGTVFKSPDNRLSGTLAGGQSVAMTG